MKVKRTLMVMLILAGILAAFTVTAQAEGKHKSSSLKDKFFKKAHYLLMRQDEYDLTDEQVEKIAALKKATKKDLIMKAAEIDVIKVDIKSALWQDTINLNAVNKLIDQKYAIKKAKSKVLVKAFADLKSILTDDQKAMMKAHYRAMKKGSHGKHKGSHRGSKGSM